MWFIFCHSLHSVIVDDVKLVTLTYTLKIRPVFLQEEVRSEMHIYFLLSHKGRRAGFLTPDLKNLPRGRLCLHALRHNFTPPSQKSWMTRNCPLLYAHLLLEVTPPFIRTFPWVPGKLHPRFGFIVWAKKVFQNGLFYLQSVEHKT